MSRTFLSAAAILGSLALAAPAFAQAATIRIEPRPYYGATVTLEQGVRVWRTLPPTRYVIINPDNRTPLNLNLADVHEHVTSRNTYQGAADGGVPVVDGGYLGGPRGLLPSRPFGTPPVAHHHNRGGHHGVHRGGLR